jgi:hypothetical protein
VRPPVVLGLKVVLEAKLEHLGVWVDIGAAVESAEDIRQRCLVELLDLSVPLRVSLLAKDEEGAEILDDRRRVLGDEAGAVVQIDSSEKAVLVDCLVEASLKKSGVLRGADNDMESQASGVIEKEHGHSPGTSWAGAKVLAVRKHHVESVGVLKTAAITALALFSVSDRKPESLCSAVDGGAIDGIVGLENPILSGSSDDLGDRDSRVFGFLVHQERDEGRR